MNLLRRLIVAACRDDSTKPPEKALAEAALLLRRSGLEREVYEDEHGEVTLKEVNALAEAGETLKLEHLELFFRELAAPGTLRDYRDGGKARKRELIEREIARERARDEARGGGGDA